MILCKRKRTQMIFIRKSILALLLGISCCNEDDKEKSLSQNGKVAEIGKIRLKDLSEQPINLEKYKGKTIFLNFWATWCKPCIEEMPTIEKAQNILHNEDVVFLLASGESAEEINAFRNAHDYKFNFARIENSEELNIQTLPTTFIFNPEGELVFLETGYRKWDEKNNIEMIRRTANKND